MCEENPFEVSYFLKVMVPRETSSRLSRHWHLRRPIEEDTLPPKALSQDLRLGIQLVLHTYVWTLNTFNPNPDFIG